MSAPPEHRCAGNLRRTLGIRRDYPKIIQNLRPSNVFLDLQFYSVLYPLTELPNSTYGVSKNEFQYITVLHVELPMLILPTKIIPGLHHLRTSLTFQPSCPGCNASEGPEWSAAVPMHRWRLSFQRNRQRVGMDQRWFFSLLASRNLGYSLAAKYDQQ